MSMLAQSKLVAFVGSSDLGRSQTFYEGTLGLSIVDVSPFAVVADAHGTELRITQVPAIAPASYTVLGWTVSDIAAEVDALVDGGGVSFTRFAGMDQDDRGVWRAPGGAQVAWFTDPDGNVLSLTQPA
jgi:catechol 2,3-dioxygenase-like lactoylglutathione lyase family enzyme